jgi:hypothetical protein
MGTRMDYSVAAEDNNFMVVGWLDASGSRGIPRTFVINAEGKIAWIGHAKDLAEVLPKMVDNTWDLKEASTKWKSDNLLHKLDVDAHYELANYWGDPLKTDDMGKPDSALFLINSIVKNEPKL